MSMIYLQKNNFNKYLVYSAGVFREAHARVL